MSDSKYWQNHLVHRAASFVMSFGRRYCQAIPALEGNFLFEETDNAFCMSRGGCYICLECRTNFHRPFQLEQLSFFETVQNRNQDRRAPKWDDGWSYSWTE